MMTRSSHQRRVALGLPLLLAALPFLHSMAGFQLAWEDPSYLLRNKPIQSLHNIPRFFGLRYWNEDIPTPTRSYRPIREVTFALDYALWGQKPWGYRLTSIALHVAATAAFYVLASTWLPGPTRRPACLAACVFALHPSRVETVVYAKNKAEILAAVFVLLSVLLWDLAMRTERAGGRRLARYAAALGLFVLALLSKATAIALPCALVAAVLCRSRSPFARRLMSVAPFFVIVAIVVYANTKFIEKDTGLTGALSELSMLWRPALVVETWHRYLGLALFPANLHADRLLSPPDAPCWAWLVGFGGWCLLGAVVALRGPGKAPNCTLGLAWFVAFLAPVLNIMLIEGRPVAEQRLYVPLVGLCLGVGRAILRDRNRCACLLVAVVAYAALSCERVFAWRTNTALWFDNVLASPEKSKPRNNLAVQYGKAKRYSLAKRQLIRALRLNPKLGDAMYNLGAICRDQGRLREANVWYANLLRLDPERDDAWLSAGNVFWRLKRYDLAEKAFRSLMECEPQDFKAYVNLAGVYFDQKRYTDAEGQLRQAMVLSPGNADLHVNLGQVLDLQGRPTEALKCYGAALNLDETNALAHIKFGQAMLSRGDSATARQAFTAAVRAAPENWQGWLGLAATAQASGDRPLFDRALERLHELKPEVASSLRWQDRETP